MPFGTLTTEMVDAIRHVVQGQIVWDLGAGDLWYATELLHLGAAQVIAVDKERLRDGVEIPEGCTFARMGFHHVQAPPEGFDVAFLSWPTNYMAPGLVPLLEAARTVIYLGANTGGSACGDSRLWDHFAQRRIEVYVPCFRNSLIVYGEYCGWYERPMVGEEIGATCGVMLTFEEAEARAKWLQEVLKDDETR